MIRVISGGARPTTQLCTDECGPGVSVARSKAKMQSMTAVSAAKIKAALRFPSVFTRSDAN